MENFLTLTKDNIDSEHICCAFSDKKCSESYQLKKEWLKKEFDNGYVFRRIEARAKVFIEYGPGEKAWLPISAKNYMNINCLWVSGKYKKNGYAKELLNFVIQDAKAKGMNGLVIVVGTKKFHFMSDTKWFLKQGFETIETLPNGFSLLVKKFNSNAENPSFKDSVKVDEIKENNGLVVYYSNRCPFAEYHATISMKESAEKRKLPLKLIKLETMEEAQSAPSPASIFSLFYNGKFITTDLSVCMDSRFDKILKI